MRKINIGDKEYPKQLKILKNSPQKLYIKGNIELLYKPGIAIVGTRRPTEYGEKYAKKFAEELSLYGLNVISGMAEGIDSFSHIGCLEVQGGTIAVLPCGFNNIFPKKNIELYNKILENNGLIISEYEENEKAEYNKFLERNRIVAGLALGTLVIEGGYRSGTSVTARLTKEQGKNVFCIPSSLENSKGIMPNKLIKEGAFLVTKPEDIIENYPQLVLKKRIKPKNKILLTESMSDSNNKKVKRNVPEEYKEIFNLLDYEKSIHVNEIAKKCKMDMQDIISKLMMMEIEELVISIPGNSYKKNK